MNESLKKQIEMLYVSGELTIEEISRVKEKFSFVCNFCQNTDIALITKTEDDGYCETCSSPYALFTIKCKKCGQGISIRD